MDFLCRAVDDTRPAEHNRTIVKKINKDAGKRSKTNPMQAASGTSLQGNAVEHPSSTLQKSAWKVIIPINSTASFKI
jgi:hypothetical protein